MWREFYARLSTFGAIVENDVHYSTCFARVADYNHRMTLFVEDQRTMKYRYNSHSYRGVLIRWVYLLEHFLSVLCNSYFIQSLTKKIFLQNG